MSGSQASIIQAAAGRQSMLVREIAALDHIEEEVTNDINGLKDLLVKYKCLTAELGWATEKMEKERAEHLEIKGSVVDKWSSKLTGRGNQFKEMASREEREYMDALQEEEKVRNALEKVTFEIQELTVKRNVHQDAYERRLHLQQELEALYDHLFSGPNPMYPQEDELEQRLSSAQAAHQAAQSTLNLETETLSLLNQAQAFLSRSFSGVQRAESANKWDMLGDKYADLVEARELGNANQHMFQYQQLFQQAQRLNGAVKQVQTGALPQQSTSDIMFDNIFSDYAMNQKYQAGVNNLDNSLTQMEIVCREARRRVEGAKEHANHISEHLTKTRNELNDCRSELFTRIVESTPWVQKGIAPSSHDPQSALSLFGQSTPSVISSLAGPPPYSWATNAAPLAQQSHYPNFASTPVPSQWSGQALPRDSGHAQNPLLDRTLGLPAPFRATPVIRAEPEQPPWVK